MQGDNRIMGGDIFKENAVIITGASSGIGKELAFLLASEGALVALAARNTVRLEEIASKCTELGGKALVVTTDVSDEGQCRNLIDTTVAEFGRIDTLINNAGYGLRGRLDEMPNLERFKGVIDTNLLGSVYCTYYALPHIKRTKGRIVAISSVSGKIGTPENTAYCASKFAMGGFFDSLRLELKEDGVSVTVVYPGFVVTEFAERIMKPDGTLVGEDGKKVYTRYTMTAKTCARIIRDAAANRRRSLVLTPEGRFGVWLNNHLPGIADRIIISHFRARKKKLGKGNAVGRDS
jgi:short-subunit dehydrogenase